MYFVELSLYFNFCWGPLTFIIKIPNYCDGNLYTEWSSSNLCCNASEKHEQSVICLSLKTSFPILYLLQPLKLSTAMYLIISCRELQSYQCSTFNFFPLFQFLTLQCSSCYQFSTLSMIPPNSNQLVIRHYLSYYM